MAGTDTFGHKPVLVSQNTEFGLEKGRKTLDSVRIL